MHLRLETHIVLIVTVLCLVFTAISCSSGPAPPAQGSTEWYWANAGTTWDTGDLLKTEDNLESVAKADSPLAPQAQPWRLILAGGLAAGYMDLADALERGGKANPEAAANFRRQMNDFRSMTNRQVAQFFQTFMEFKKTGGATAIPLAFSFPKGSAVAVPALARLSEGAAISEAEMFGAERRVLQRAVLMEACRAVGAENDTAKTQQVFSAENATVAREIFMLAMANRLHEMAGYYGSNKIDQPDRVKMFNEMALEIVKSLPESDDSKELIKEIEDELKG
jgi:hypothetical protein